MNTIPIPIAIPGDLAFTDLRLARDASGDVSFDLATIERIERANGLPEGYFMSQPEDVLAELIVAWYGQHLHAGGAPDPVAQDLIGEVAAEESAGQRVSLAPGRA